jgi:hypothetical protein
MKTKGYTDDFIAIKSDKIIKEQNHLYEQESSSGSQTWSHHSEDKEGDDFLSKEQFRRIFVAKNHLRLNAIINVFLFACVGFVFFLDWFCLPGVITGVSIKHDLKSRSSISKREYVRLIY